MSKENWFKKILRQVGEWLSKKENREKLVDGVEKGAEILAEKLEKKDVKD